MSSSTGAELYSILYLCSAFSAERHRTIAWPMLFVVDDYKYNDNAAGGLYSQPDKQNPQPVDAAVVLVANAASDNFRGG